MTKEVAYGSLKKGGYGNPKVTKEVTYYKDEVDGTVITEIDKFNYKYVVNGVDMLEGISDMI
jgi:P2 family phage contractile tail tube protein